MSLFRSYLCYLPSLPPPPLHSTNSPKTPNLPPGRGGTRDIVRDSLSLDPLSGFCHGSQGPSLGPLEMEGCRYIQLVSSGKHTRSSKGCRTTSLTTSSIIQTPSLLNLFNLLRQSSGRLGFLGISSCYPHHPMVKTTNQ